MGVLRGSWVEVVAGLTGGAWAVASLADGGLARSVMIGVVVAVAVLPVRQRPLLAGLAIIGLEGSGRLLGIPADNPWDLAAAVMVLFALGRFGRRPWNLGVAAAFWVVFVASDLTAPTVAFGAVFVAAPWALGALARQRAQRAGRAARTAAALASLDIEQRIARAAAEERARLAGDVLGVIRSGVLAMRQHAERAAAQLDSVALDAVQNEGRRVTSELRRLLGLLRSEEPAETSKTTGNETLGRSELRWGRELLIVAGLIALFAVEVTAAASETGSAPGAVSGMASLMLISTIVMRNRHATVACLAAASVSTVSLVLAIPLAYGLWSGVVGALLAWSVAISRNLHSYFALAVFSGVMLLDVQQQDPDNVAITLVTILLGAIGGHVWAGHARDERAARAAATTIRARHEEMAERAVRAERLRLARELHDVASHAVGVMVLQAAAAQALRDREPQRAQEAVRTAERAATEALTQLGMLSQLLDAGAVGVAGVAASAPVTDLPEALEQLVDRMCGAGLQVNLKMVGHVPDSPALRATVYRIVQESLTNAMRYAPGSAVGVGVSETGDGLEVLVQDDGPHPHLTAAPSNGGFGLVGLRERVAVFGGSLEAAPRPSGGFAVRASLPVPQHVQPHS